MLGVSVRSLGDQWAALVISFCNFVLFTASLNVARLGDFNQFMALVRVSIMPRNGQLI